MGMCVDKQMRSCVRAYVCASVRACVCVCVCVFTRVRSCVRVLCVSPNSAFC